MLMCLPSRVEPVEEVQQRVGLEINELFPLVCINRHVEVAGLEVDRPTL